MPTVGDLVSFIGQIVLGISRARALVDLAKTIETFMKMAIRVTIDVAETFAWSGMRLNWYWNNAVEPAAKAVIPTWEGAGNDVWSITHRLITVIIPNSVKAGTSKVYPHLAALEKLVAADHHGLIVLNNYTRNTVEPQVTILQQEVRPWLTFQHNWRTTYGPAVRALIDFLHHPGDLSKLLAPTMTPDVVNALAWKSNRPIVDRLLRILLGDLKDVTTAADSGIVALLQSGSY